MPKELTVSEWFDEIDNGLRYRKQYGMEDKWYELEKAFYGVIDPRDVVSHSGPNIILSTGDALLSTLSVPEPYVTVKAQKMDSVPKARIVESIANGLIRQTEMSDQVEMAILHNYLFGKGILKFGYDSEYGWDQTLDIGLQNPIGATLSMFDKKLQRIEYNNIQPGMPWVKAVCPHDIVVPWGTVTFDDAAWVAHRVVRHIDDVKADLKYSKTRNLQPTMSRADYMKSYENPFRAYRAGETISTSIGGDEDEQYVELWEIRHRKTGKIFVIVSGYTEFIRNEFDPLQMDGVPFVETSFTARARSFWVPSDAYYLLYHHAELRDIAIQSTKHRRLMVLKFMYTEGAINDEEMDSLLSGVVGAGVKVAAGMSLDQVVRPFTPPSPNMQLAQDSELIRRNARELVGFSRNQIGEYESSGRRTATEANIVQENSALRLDRRQAMVAKMYNQGSHKMLSIVRSNWKLPRLVQVLDPNGIPNWVSISPDQLAGEFNFQTGFSVNTGETLQQRRSQAFQLYMIMRQDPTMDQAAVSKFIANAMNDPEWSALYKPGVLDGQGMQIPAQTAAGGVPLGSAPVGTSPVPAQGGLQASSGANNNPGQ